MTIKQVVTQVEGKTGMNWMEAYTAQPKAEKMGQCGFCGGNTRRGLRNEPAIVHVGVPVAGYPWHMAEREKEQ